MSRFALHHKSVLELGIANHGLRFICKFKGSRSAQEKLIASIITKAEQGDGEKSGGCKGSRNAPALPD